MFSNIILTVLSFLIINSTWFVPGVLDINNLIDKTEIKPGVLSKDIKIIKSKVLENYSNKEDEFKVDAGKAVIYDPKADIFLYQKNSQEVQSIASITKLMTALVVIDQNPDWQDSYQITKEDRKNGGRIYLFLGDKVKIEDLFNLSLVGSANTATSALIHSLNLNEDEFVSLMNEKAKNLNLKNTNFSDPIGLSPNNVSTAKEVALLTKEALSNNKIKDTLSQVVYNTETKQGKKITAESTNLLLSEDVKPQSLSVIAGKTGYINESGFCFSSWYSDSNQGEIITVVLDAETVFSRFEDSLKLSKWIYNY